jgi:hypothetical protein
MSDDNRKPDEAGQQPCQEEENTESGRISDSFMAARQAFGRSFDRLTGAEFRRQFEEFSNVVATTVLGVHRDQSELNERIARIEQSQRPSPSANKLVIATFVFSLVAVILGITALLRTI